MGVPGGSILFLPVQATPFEVIIPPVKPGAYRITRRFSVAPGYSQKDVILATPITVKPCPRGQRATFDTTPTPTSVIALGRRPAWVASNS